MKKSFKPISVILKKRHLALALLVACLGGAIYLNYAMSIDSIGVSSKPDEETKNYGESQWVGSELKEVPMDMEYFEEARLNRETSRDEAVATLKNILSDAELPSDKQESLAEDAKNLAKAIETEGKIENLVKAKGFSECMAYYDGKSVSIVVKSDGLKEENVAQIKDIVMETASVEPQNISIVEVG